MNYQIERSRRILVIDRQLYWREIFAHVLRSAGFIVCTLDTYAYSLDCLKGEDPDLVVLGCVCIRSEEQQLIAQILSSKHPLLVLALSLPWHVMRSLFLQGVDDNVDKPCDPSDVVNIVNQVLQSAKTHNSAQSIESSIEHE